MGKDDVLLVTGNYPHALMRHMNTLVKERGRSILWDGSFVQLFDNAFPDLMDEKLILEAAYGLGIPKRFQDADEQAKWSKRVCVTQSLFLLVQCMKEYEAVMFVESFMFFMGWDFEVSVERKWEVKEEDKANFHQPHEKKAMGQAELEQLAGEQIEKKKDGGTRGGKTRRRKEVESFAVSANGDSESVREAAGTGQSSENVTRLAKAASERRQRRRDDKKKDKEGERKALAGQSEISRNAKKTAMQVDPDRDVMYMAQMNIGMRREVKRAKKGNADSQQKLGSFYSEEGTKHLDYKEAVYWYQLSANQGNYKAQLELGRIFDSGKVQTEGSKLMGIYWYRKLAEEGFPTAQCILGAKYLWGDGVEENKKEAVHWLKKAAAQGYEEAKEYLAGIFGG